MPRINREEFLKTLQSVTPGTSAKDITDQSSCFVFTGKKVVTFNDEIACWLDCKVPIKGAVQAKPLLELLRKMTEDQIDVSVQSDKLVVKGKSRRARFVLEAEITLPIKAVHLPKTWQDLPNDFLDGISMVQEVAETKEDQSFVTLCVHIHPDYLEAAREYQVCRFKTKTPVGKPTLVRRDSIKHVVAFGMTEFGETTNWIHFRNNTTGLILSCRRYVEEEFFDTRAALKIKGTKITLPKGIEAAANKAAIFSAENVDDSDVLITIKNGKLTIGGTGASGDYTEVKKTEHVGGDIQFMISPVLLSNIVKKHNECIVSKDKLKIRVGKFSYVTVLGSVENEEG